jgi:hypothetical protein
VLRLQAEFLASTPHVKNNYKKTYHLWYKQTMNTIKHKKVSVRFFRTASGSEPVREWLLSLTKEDRSAIGQDIKTAEYGWPIGMPTCRSMGDGKYELI